jgi:SpoVK/Ycf46/Vps4 family AAA+-type ATPase
MTGVTLRRPQGTDAMERQEQWLVAGSMLEWIGPFSKDLARWQMPLAVEKPIQELVARIHHDRQKEAVEQRNTWVRNGVRAVFMGGRGPSKRLTALHVARAVEMPLYRVDLSRVVSQYIGDTEKNLDRVFETATEAGAILFFDEVDSLFGGRDAGEGGNDRYGNLDLAYLIRNIEAFRGIVILASNRKVPIDGELSQRAHCVVDFEGI